MNFNKYLSFYFLEDFGIEIKKIGDIIKELINIFFLVGFFFLSYSCILRGREGKSVVYICLFSWRYYKI